MLHVEHRRIIKSVVLIELICRMKVDDTWMPAGCEHTLHSLHRDAVERHVVEINAVDSDLLRHPVDLFDRRIFVIETARPLPVGVDLMKRCYEQREIIEERLALLHNSRSAVVFDQNFVLSGVDIDSAFSVVAPRGREQEWLLQIKIG